jgi:hypothetical protein
MMYSIVDHFAQLVAAAPNPVVVAGSVAAQKPSTSGDMPALAVSVAITDQRTTGLGHVMRSGEFVTRTTAVVNVGGTAAGFSPDLRQLRLQSLPLRKNPVSSEGALTGDDVQVTNVTDSTHPIRYRFARRPTAPDEFAIDPEQARLAFGAAQTAGHSLEIVHWTVTWRDDIEGAAYRGVLTVEVWAEGLADLTATSRRLQDRPFTHRPLLRQLGFSRLEAAGFLAAEHVLHTPVAGSAFAAWRQLLTYRFAFEVERPAEDSRAGPIRRIDVDMHGAVQDAVRIPRPVS